MNYIITILYKELKFLEFFIKSSLQESRKQEFLEKIEKFFNNYLHPQKSLKFSIRLN
jgi:hypothetical protein